MQVGQKVRLMVDHNNKPLKTPKYGYIVSIHNRSKSLVVYFTEKPGNPEYSEAYLIQTRCFGGALWYTSDAFKPAGGKNQWEEWKRKIAEFHEANT
jgi:hypothetical protein